jgi:hypothetical protein
MFLFIAILRSVQKIKCLGSIVGLNSAVAYATDFFVFAWSRPFKAGL